MYTGWLPGTGIVSDFRVHQVYIIIVNHGNSGNSGNNGISNLQIPLEQAGFNSVPGHHIYQWLSKPARNFTPVISHLWSLTALSRRLSSWRVVNFRIASIIR